MNSYTPTYTHAQHTHLFVWVDARMRVCTFVMCVRDCYNCQ